jgi:hypothetical protein
MSVLDNPLTAALQLYAAPSRVSNAGAIPNQSSVVPKTCRWLISPRADFWFASAGASAGLVAALALIVFYGDRELDWLDLVFSELHLGATYDAIIRRRLWRRFPADVLIVPLAILAATYALAVSNQLVLLTSIAMYAAVWHRGRQSLGVARFYQRQSGGPISPLHRWLFAGAIYLPMVAAIFLYGHLAPENYEGEPYYAVGAGAQIAWGLGLIACAWVVAYLVWTSRRLQRQRESNVGPTQKNQTLHRGERWVVLAHAVAFGSAYILGAANASFLFVLAIHHEVQYLYFTYAMARRPVIASEPENFLENPQSEIRFAASFIRWPLIGLAGAIAAGWYQLEWLAPFGIGGLFCHYWLDGRIWTRRAMKADTNG